ncbi:MAG: hypothetical protein AAF960_14550 [Bacteroidota bacterium]
MKCILSKITQVALLLTTFNSLTAQTASISVTVQFVNDIPLENVEVVLLNGTETVKTTTDQQGNYAFDNIPVGASVSMSANYNTTGEVLNGNSTFDLVLTTQHILGTQRFEDGYQYFAMDINKSKSVTAFDLVLGRNLILGIITEYPNGNNWRFINTDVLEDFQPTEAFKIPTDFSDVYQLTVSDQGNEVNFTGIKVGDASGNAVAN